MSAVGPIAFITGGPELLGYDPYTCTAGSFLGGIWFLIQMTLGFILVGGIFCAPSTVFGVAAGMVFYWLVRRQTPTVEGGASRLG